MLSNTELLLMLLLTLFTFKFVQVLGHSFRKRNVQFHTSCGVRHVYLTSLNDLPRTFVHQHFTPILAKSYLTCQLSLSSWTFKPYHSFSQPTLDFSLLEGQTHLLTCVIFWKQSIYETFAAGLQITYTVRRKPSPESGGAFEDSSSLLFPHYTTFLTFSTLL